MSIADGTVHWSSSKGIDKSKDTTQYFYQPRPVDVETTGYVLLTYMLDGDTENVSYLDTATVASALYKGNHRYLFICYLFCI